MEFLTPGTVLWRVMGKRRDGRITWHAIPKCIEKVEGDRYLFSIGGCGKDSVGVNYFLTRPEAIEAFLAKYDSLVEDIDPNSTLDGMAHPELKDRVTELPRTDWDSFTVVRWDAVDAASVYHGGLRDLKNITDDLKWRDDGFGQAGYHTEVLTLKEIYEQVKEMFPGRPVITVFQETLLNGAIYQCGSCGDGKWVKFGTTKGRA